MDDICIQTHSLLFRIVVHFPMCYSKNVIKTFYLFKIHNFLTKQKVVSHKFFFFQAFDYTNRMINLLCPLELSPRRTGGRRIDEYENASNSISNSVAESDSIDAESGFEDQVEYSLTSLSLDQNLCPLLNPKMVSNLFSWVRSSKIVNDCSIFGKLCSQIQ